MLGITTTVRGASGFENTRLNIGVSPRWSSAKARSSSGDPGAGIGGSSSVASAGERDRIVWIMRDRCRSPSVTSVGRTVMAGPAVTVRGLFHFGVRRGSPDKGDATLLLPIDRAGATLRDDPFRRPDGDDSHSHTRRVVFTHRGSARDQS